VGQRQYVRFDLPARFGEKRPALFALRTMQNVVGEAQTLPFHIYGIGCGPKAVGSVAVDQVHLGPPSYSLKRDKTHKDDRITCDYNAHSSFERGTLDVMLVELKSGFRVARRVRSDAIKPQVSAGPGKRDWDGKFKDQPDVGRCFAVVRVWTDPNNDGSWVGAISEEEVEITK
jgi:hypothetical protein